MMRGSRKHPPDLLDCAPPVANYSPSKVSLVHHVCVPHTVPDIVRVCDDDVKEDGLADKHYSPFQEHHPGGGD